MAHTDTLHPAPRLRLPFAALTALGFLLFMLAGAAIFPQPEAPAYPDWRGNSASLGPR